jgi:hypothetical protein
MHPPVQEDSLQLLFDRLGAKANGLHVGPGMVKYGWQDGPVFNLDDGTFRLEFRAIKQLNPLV